MNTRCSKHTDRETMPAACRVCVRVNVEADIVTRTVDALLAADYALNVNNGGGRLELAFATKDRETILSALMATDEEFLIAFGRAGTRWVKFVYGNDGWDVICDYHVGIEDALAPVNAYAESLA